MSNDTTRSSWAPMRPRYNPSHGRARRMTGIREWLRAHGLDSYAELFEREQIDVPAARHLTEAALKELGLPMGPRLKLLAAIRELADAPIAEHDTAVETDVHGAPASASPPYAERRQLTVM